MKLSTTTLLALITSLALTACGGGGGSNDNTPQIADDDPLVLPLGFQLADSFNFPGDTDCSSTMAGFTQQYGKSPEETYPSSGWDYDERTQEYEQVWFYWADGVGIDWVWGGSRNGCDSTTFSFTPIR